MLVLVLVRQLLVEATLPQLATDTGPCDALFRERQTIDAVFSLLLVSMPRPSHSMASPSFVDLIQVHTATGWWQGSPKPTGNVSRCGLIHGMACCPLTAEIDTTDISCLELSTTPLRTTEDRANRVRGGLSYRPVWT